jgi:hypothetical protein
MTTLKVIMKKFDCLYDVPGNVETFVSSKVPWKYQNVNMKNYAKNINNDKKDWSKGLEMVRVWSSTLKKHPEGVTVAGAVEITGLVYSAGVPIDEAHLDVMLFRIPRTVSYFNYGYTQMNNDDDKDSVTVYGTVRQVLQQLHDGFSNHEFRYAGLSRSFERVMKRSTKYSLSFGIAVKMSPERAKWQQKMRNVLGVDGGMDNMAIGLGPEKLGRSSIYSNSYNQKKK